MMMLRRRRGFMTIRSIRRSAGRQKARSQTPARPPPRPFSCTHPAAPRDSSRSTPCRLDARRAQRGKYAEGDGGNYRHERGESQDGPV